MRIIRFLLFSTILVSLAGCSGWYINPFNGEMSNYSRAEAAKEKRESAVAYGRSAELSAQMGYEEDSKWQRENEARLHRESSDDFWNGLFEILLSD